MKSSFYPKCLNLILSVLSGPKGLYELCSALVKILLHTAPEIRNNTSGILPGILRNNEKNNQKHFYLI